MPAPLISDRMLGVLLGSTLSQLALPAAALAQREQPITESAAPTDEITDPVAPTTARVQLGVGASIGYVAFSPPESSPPLNRQGLSGDAAVTATVFLQRVVDSPAPLSLQPFLQRVGSLQVSGGGGGFHTRADDGAQFYSDRQQAHGSGSLALDVYVRRFLALTATFAGHYASVTDTASFKAPFAISPFYSRASIAAISSSVGVGLRLADTRIDLAYAVTLGRSESGPFQVPFWGGVAASVRTVIRQYLDLSLQLGLLDQGGTGSVGVALYPDSSLAVFAAVFYGHGILYLNDTVVRDRVGGTIGGAMWFSRRVGTSLSYAPTWVSDTTPTLSHGFSLDIFLRT